MRKFARSEAYAKWRLVNSGLFVVLGVAVGIHTYQAAGFSGQTIPSYVLAAAMVGLGFFRLRAYRDARAAAK